MANQEEQDDLSLQDIFAGIDLGDKEEEAKAQEKSVEGKRTKERHFERRIKSELALEQELPWHFEKGSTYHCISFGDVDSLTYLRVIVKQQRIRYVLLSTWCMAITDAEEIKKWLDAGYIDRVDFYVGEIFTKQYAGVYQFIRENCIRNGGRIAVFRNHSKVIAGFGDQFDFAVASSANINTNPRCENTTITINPEVANFYKNFFDGIKSFNRDFDDWKPWEN
jgi:hypothetical protein